MDFRICNRIGSIPECQNCSAAKPSKDRKICPHGQINYCITKFIGFLKVDKKGKYYVTLNGEKIPGLIPDDQLTIPKNVNKRLVFWVTEAGIIAHRHPMNLQKVH